MKKKLYSLMVAIVLLVTLLPLGLAESAIEEGAELVYMSMWGEAEPQGMIIAEAIDAFTQETGVQIDVQFTAREIRKTLEPALAAGERIDLFDEDIERVTGAWGKYLLPLDGLASEEYLEGINQTLITLAKKIGNGDGEEGLYMIPYQPSTFVMFYNKDLFDAAGITESPKTWDEFLAACQALVDSGVIPMTVDDAYMGALFGYTLDRIAGAQKVGEMVSNVDLSDPSVLRAAQVWEEMVTKGYMDKRAAGNVWPQGQTNISDETVAMYLNGTWLPNEIKQQVKEGFRWGSFAFPAIDETGDGIESNNYGAQCFAINKDTPYPNAAFAFIQFMTTGEYDQRLADESMGVPMSNDASWPAELAEAKGIIDASTNRLSWAVGMEDNNEIHVAIKDGFAKLIAGTITAQEFADALAAVK
ncbi:MAG: extracellular solute-binding protein [Clostridiales bacterium]|nr:extracellular solute-binding protein [Clostridiales bacterium]